jgi:hypothetical protein
MPLTTSSALADATFEEYRLFDELLEASRSDQWERHRRLLDEWSLAQKRRRELTPLPTGFGFRGV